MTKTQKNNGFLYYAHNNEEVNYLRLAICSSLSGHHFIDNFRVTVVTDDYSLAAMTEQDKNLMDKCFENIIIDNTFFKMKNYKSVVDVYDDKGLQPWYNGTRTNAYNDSPYNETILLDVDFIFQDRNLNKVFGLESPVKITKRIIPILKSEKAEKTKFLRDENVGHFTIPMYWATLVYFNRSEFSKTFFDLVEHIKDNYFHYKKLYQVDDITYRNDYSFSMALHTMNGFRVPGPEFEIPYEFILTTSMDSVYRVDKGSTKFIMHSRDWPSQWHMFNIENISYHCFNKLSLLSKYDQFIEVYDE